MTIQSANDPLTSNSVMSTGLENPQAIARAAPRCGLPAGLDHPPAMGKTTPMPTTQAGLNFPDATPDTPPLVEPRPGPNHPSARGATTPTPQSQTGPASHPPTICHAAPTAPPSAGGPILADPVLGLCADIVDDLETVRIANENRLRQLCDPGELGHGLSTEHPQVKRLSLLVDALNQSEHQAVLNLRKAMREHPIGGWVAQTQGVGEKQAARLLATIRDPYWNDLHDRPRTVSELWAYCGFHVLHPGGQSVTGAHGHSAAGVAPYRQRGHKSNWNDHARKRVWLIAAQCIKYADSPYRAVYDDTRAKYADAVHTIDCRRCGPSGSPAPAGSPLTPGHQHGRAIRAMCKEILRDLWREAKAIHEKAPQ